jgi:hypothetical protein
MAPFKALYGRQCRTPLSWIELSERMIFHPYIVTESKEIVHHIQYDLKAARVWQESYANKRRQPLEFEAGDRVYLCVLSTQGVERFVIKGRLAPCYICPFPILAKLGNVAYRLELPPSLAGVHNVFHVS